MGLGAACLPRAPSRELRPSGLCAEMREASGHGEDGLSVQGRAGGGAWAAGVGAEFLKWRKLKVSVLLKKNEAL